MLEPSPTETDLGHPRAEVVSDQGVGEADFHLLEQLPAPSTDFTGSQKHRLPRGQKIPGSIWSLSAFPHPFSALSQTIQVLEANRAQEPPEKPQMLSDVIGCPRKSLFVSVRVS